MGKPTQTLPNIFSEMNTKCHNLSGFKFKIIINIVARVHLIGRMFQELKQFIPLPHYSLVKIYYIIYTTTANKLCNRIFPLS